jgi:hypothetical protein
MKVAEPEGSILLVGVRFGPDPKLLPATSHDRNLFPVVFLDVILLHPMLSNILYVLVASLSLTACQFHSNIPECQCPMF